MKSAVLFIVCVILVVNVAAAQEPVPSKPGNGVSMPKLIKEVKPSYTAEAIRARIQGIVRLEIVVKADGTVGDVRVVQSLDPLLDSEAIKTAKQWVFAPGIKDGVAVPVAVQIEMTFTLKDDRGPKVGSPDVFKPGDGVMTPKVLSETKPEYPPETKASGVQGLVTLECVVLPSGRVGDVAVKKSLEPTLDQAAIRAMRQWRFTPGTKDGKPVPVQVEVEMTFTLR
jgi:TonB family protein